MPVPSRLVVQHILWIVRKVRHGDDDHDNDVNEVPETWMTLVMAMVVITTSISSTIITTTSVTIIPMTVFIMIVRACAPDCL